MYWFRCHLTVSKNDRNHCLHGIYILVAGERNTSTKSMTKLRDTLESINAMEKINQRRNVCKLVEIGKGGFYIMWSGEAWPLSPDLNEMWEWSKWICRNSMLLGSRAWCWDWLSGGQGCCRGDREAVRQECARYVWELQGHCDKWNEQWENSKWGRQVRVLRWEAGWRLTCNPV